MTLFMAACSTPNDAVVPRPRDGGSDQAAPTDLARAADQGTAIDQAGAPDAAAELRGVNEEILEALDGQLSVLGPETRLHSAVFLRGRGGLSFAGGRYWFVEGTTSCGGNWGARTVSFLPGADGSVADQSQVCESATGAPVGTHLVAQATKGLCYTTHAPSLEVRCGRLLDQPGTYRETVFFGGPGEVWLAGFGGGFGAVYQELTSGALWLRRLDALMTPVGTVSLGVGSRVTQTMAAAQVGEELWVVHGQQKEALDLERVTASGTVLAPQRLPAVGRAFGTVPVALEAAAQGGALAVALAVDTDVYQGVLHDGGTGFRRVFASSAIGGPSENTLLSAKLVVRGGETLVLVADAGPAPRVYLLRLDAAARLRERPLVVSDRAGSVFGAALDETGRGLWVVYTARTGVETVDVQTRRITLP